jgi:hypothetical protein
MDRWRRPEVFLAELLGKSVRREFLEEDRAPQIWLRAAVLAVDVRGGLLENEQGAGELEHIVDGRPRKVPANIGPANPRNSIKARIVSSETDQFIEDDLLRVFWPMMPEHDAIPVKPGEHVYVTFEDEDRQHGLWFGKVPGHEGVNFFKGESSYVVSKAGQLSSLFEDGGPPPGAPETDTTIGGRLVPRDKASLFSEGD